MYRAILIAVILAGNVSAASQILPQTPQIKAEIKADRSPKYKSDTQSAQAISGAITIAAVPNNNNSQQDANHGDQEGTEFWTPFLGLKLKITDSLLVIFTLVLAVFTGLLWCSTNKLWKETNASVAVARDAAIAAQTSADALIAIECAWIALGGDMQIRELESIPVAGAPRIPNITFGLSNTGKSPAWILSSKARMMIVNSEKDLPTEPDYGEQWDYPDGIPLNCGNVRPEQVFIDSNEITPEQLAKIKRGELFIVFYGFVKYRDVFNRVRETRYCLFWREPIGINSKGSFSYGGPKSYNKQT